MSKTLLASIARVDHLYLFLAVIGASACCSGIDGVIYSRHERHVSRQRAVSESEDRKQQELALQAAIYQADPVQRLRLCAALSEFKASREAEVSAALRERLHDISAQSRAHQRDCWYLTGAGATVVLLASHFWLVGLQRPINRILQALAEQEERAAAEAKKQRRRKARRRKASPQSAQGGPSAADVPGVAV